MDLVGDARFVLIGDAPAHPQRGRPALRHLLPYIQQRRLRVDTRLNRSRARLNYGDSLRSADIRLIEAVDTCFLGTARRPRATMPPIGQIFPGFVRDLSADPTAALQFMDFRAGTALQLSAEATRTPTPGVGETDHLLHPGIPPLRGSEVLPSTAEQRSGT